MSRNSISIFRRLILMVLLVAWLEGCAGKVQTQVKGNLDQVSPNLTLAILPVATTDSGQKDASRLFRQNLFANFKRSRFRLMERYLVDGLLKQNGLNKPTKIRQMSPIRLGEILGADVVLFSEMTKVKRSYALIHSSIELGVLVRMADTRTGETLWKASQTESDYEGIAKIPTGITAAILAPIEFVTNKMNLHRLTHKMTRKLTTLISNPDKSLINKTPSNPKNSGMEKQVMVEVVQKSQSVAKVNIANLIKKPSISKNDVTVKMKSKSAPIVGASFRKASMKIRPNNVEKPLPNPFEPKPGQSSVEVENIQFETQESSSKLKSAHLKKLSPSSKTLPNPLDPTVVAPEKLSLTGAQFLKNNSLLTLPAIRNLEPRNFYTVQVGSYQSRKSAEKITHGLLKKGYAAFLSLFERGKKLFYRVQVDKFETKEEAIETSRKLSGKEHMKNFVTKTTG